MFGNSIGRVLRNIGYFNIVFFALSKSTWSKPTERSVMNLMPQSESISNTGAEASSLVNRAIASNPLGYL